MRITQLIPTIFVMVILSGCTKKDEIPEDIPYEETRFSIVEVMEFKIPSILGINLPIQVPFIDVAIDFETAAENTNPYIGVVRNIKLTDFILEITSPANQSFTFLNEMIVYISADNLPEIALAHHFNVDDNIGSVMHLVTEAGFIDDYVKSESFDLRMEIVADEILAADLTISGEWVLDVELINNP